MLPASHYHLIHDEVQSVHSEFDNLLQSLFEDKYISKHDSLENGINFVSVLYILTLILRYISF